MMQLMRNKYFKFLLVILWLNSCCSNDTSKLIETGEILLSDYQLIDSMFIGQGNNCIVAEMDQEDLDNIYNSKNIRLLDFEKIIIYQDKVIEFKLCSNKISDGSYNYRISYFYSPNFDLEPSSCYLITQPKAKETTFFKISEKGLYEAHTYNLRWND